MMEMLLTLVSVALGSSGLSAIIVAILNHRWSVRSGEESKLDALRSRGVTFVIPAENINVTI